MIGTVTEFTKSKSSIYVLLTDTGTLFTSVIKQFTADPYNHASLAFDPELNDLFSFGRKSSANPWTAGFVEENLYEGTFRHFPDTRCIVLRLNVSQRQRATAAQFIQYIQSERDAYRYNLIGLLGVLLDCDLQRKRAYFCSQFVADTLRHAGLSLWNKPVSLVTPGDFLRHPAFEPVYEGRLYDYPLLDRERLDGLQASAQTTNRLGGYTA
ncbi:hypothetical protein PAESOLCIP111_06640 [Paenibacillus solanacearum]|uniref:Permuted papain-like amidase YaeF/Yiix C92 family enzyme n=1 Tax=Paenibacillus solanacearum TaxID=2048548 RepID=A0A916KAN6_9BACL|nr:hypothetical protein [Paenibacillus solanacearum]CAG7652812.1 hypothetical protein PAESOLCIP111_06640 [Paenibacillus solanacearum]